MDTKTPPAIVVARETHRPDEYPARVKSIDRHREAYVLFGQEVDVPLWDVPPLQDPPTRGRACSMLTGKRARLALLLVLLICSRSVDQVLFYRINFVFQYYIFYLSSVILPIAFLAITLPVVIYKVYLTDAITPAMRRFPQWKFAVLGLLDAVFNILSTFPVQHLGGSMSNILSQTVLPFNMLLSFLILGTRFRQPHYVGAILVLYGVAVKLMPDIFGGGESENGGNNFGWMLLLMGANVFAAGSNVFKERALKGCDMDEWWMNLWVSLWQLIFGLLCFWQGYLGAFMAPMPAIASCEECSWGTYVSDGNTCFLGGKVQIPGLSNTTCTSDVSDPIFNEETGRCELDCSEGTAPIYIFLVYIVFNITYNFLMLAVFKEGSSVLFVIANAIRLPLVDLLLMIEWLSGPAYAVFSRYDGYALFALCLGTLVYYQEKEQRQVGAEEDDAGGTGDGALIAAASSGDQGDVTPETVSSSSRRLGHRLSHDAKVGQEVGCASQSTLSRSSSEPFLPVVASSCV